MFFKKYYKMLIPLIVMLIVYLWLPYRNNNHTKSLSKQVRAMPAFKLINLMKPYQSLTEKNFRHHVVLLNIWASWCVVCQEENPVLKRIAETGQVSLYGLNYRDDRQNANAWLKRFGNPYQLIIADNDGVLGSKLGIYSAPETYLVDSKGYIRDAVKGAISWQIWQRRLLPEIKQLEQK